MCAYVTIYNFPNGGCLENEHMHERTRMTPHLPSLTTHSLACTLTLLTHSRIPHQTKTNGSESHPFPCPSIFPPPLLCPRRLLPISGLSFTSSFIYRSLSLLHLALTFRMRRLVIGSLSAATKMKSCCWFNTFVSIRGTPAPRSFDVRLVLGPHPLGGV